MRNRGYHRRTYQRRSDKRRQNFGGHAWNKVLLDLNGTGDKEWYFVDTTWGDVGDDSKEFLSHAYFLLSDDEVKTPTLKSRDTVTRKRKESSIITRTKLIRQAARNTITLLQTKSGGTANGACVENAPEIDDCGV